MSKALRDRNGAYTGGTYSDGRAVHVYGERGGFVYLAFSDDLTFVTKVPSSWVSYPSAACGSELREVTA